MKNRAENNSYQLLRAGRTLTILLLAMTIGLQSSQGADEVENEIQLSFDAYKNALIQKDGDTAARLISQDAKQVYEFYREAALSGTPEEIKQVPLVHQAGILTLRGSVPPETLMEMDGAQVYAQAINSGLIAHKWAGVMEIIEIGLINPETAVLTIGVKGEPGTQLAMVKEGAFWKISVREVLMQSNRTIEAMLIEKKVTPEQYLKTVVETQLGPGTYENLWRPPAKRVRSAEGVWEEEPE